MDILELGAIGELVGGIAVIASLLYVGLQVRQNKKALSSTRHVDTLRYGQTAVARFIEDKDFAAFILEAQNAPDQLDTTDWERFSYFAFQAFSTWEAAYIDREQGLIAEDYWHGWDRVSRRFLQSFGYRRFWERERSGFAPSFQRYVEDHVLGNTAGA